MDVLRSHYRCFNVLLIVLSLLFLLTTSSAASLNRFSGKLGERRNEEIDELVLPGRILDQKQALVPVASPVNCTSKCMKCEPCETVLISLQPGEEGYYPEVWRCRCGGELFMP